jgi:flavin reductase (DIM6/NTAB) family NADH-FMN oxidoreductase RutF
VGEVESSVFFNIGYGVYLISSLGADGKYNAQVANVLFQVTAEPAQFAICINKSNLTHEYIRQSMVFGVSILEEDTPMTFIGPFGFKSGRDVDKLMGVTLEVGPDTGVPLVIDHSVGVMDFEVVSELDAVTHTLFIGKVRSARGLKAATPMTYKHYHEIKGGKSPKSAPTFMADKIAEGVKK